MFCYIKEWPNKMATLMASDGAVLCTCQNIDEARQVWRNWKQHQHPQISETTETDLQIVPYSPTMMEWLKTVFVNCNCTIRRSRKITIK